MKSQLSHEGGQGTEGKAPLQHHKSGNKDFGKVLIELKMSLPMAEGLDSMAMRGPFHSKPFCDSKILKDQLGCPHTAKKVSPHTRDSPLDIQGCTSSPQEEPTPYLISQRMQHILQPLPRSCHPAASPQEEFWIQARFCME